VQSVPPNVMEMFQNLQISTDHSYKLYREAVAR
jgi:hypothetical protein